MNLKCTRFVLWLCLASTAILLFPEPVCAQPANNTFANGQALSGNVGSVTGSNVGATKETGEPNHAGNVGGHSIWYRWVAPASTVVTIDTIGSGFDTLLAVYTGASVSGLTTIVSNDDIDASNIRSRVSFTPIAGTTYQIAVDGYNGATGNITLNWSQAPPPAPVNDAFAGAQVLSGNSGSATGSNSSATKESGEPNHAGNAGGRSIWYRWVAPASTVVTIDTVGSAFNTLLAVYTGSSVSSLSAIASNDDIDGSNTRSSVSFTAVAGTAYQIAVDGFGGLAGNVTLTWSQAAPPPPANDTFANAQALSGSSGSVTGGNANATKESGEPNHAGNAGGHSLWYRWVAPSGTVVTIDTLGSSFDTLLAVYTGGVVSGLTTIVSNDDIDGSNTRSRVSFTPVAGSTYQIAVDGYNGASGNVTLNWNQTAGPPPTPPANDAFSSAQVLGGGSGSVNGSNANATKENGEPNHAGNAGGRSVWYRWTAPTADPVTLETVGSAFNTLLAVYTGSSVSSLNTIASNDDIDGSNTGSRVSFTPVAGTTYQIAVDGFNGAAGSVTLSWTQGAPPPPPLSNDAFVNAQSLTGSVGSVTGSNVGASKETGEPNHAGNAGGHSIWFRWVAPAGTVVTIDTIGSSFDTLLAVYTGASVNGLTTIVSNDDIDASNIRSRVSFTPVAGVTYQIAADGYNGASGNVTLNWSQSAPPPLANDAFASAQVLSGSAGSVSGSNVNATKESGEPNHAGNAGGRSIWYRWTAPTASLVTIDTVGSAFNTLLAVYTGGSVSSLSAVASNDDIDGSNTRSRVSFAPVAGTTYQIAVDGFGGAAGGVTLNWNQAAPPAPANDAFANAQALSGSSGSVTGGNANASKESGEPNHAGNAGGRSIWYRWVAPAGTAVTIDTIGSGFDTLLAVYTGGSVSGLTTIVSNDDIDASNTRSRVSFTPVAGTTYQIAVDGYNGATGNITLNWTQSAPPPPANDAFASAQVLSGSSGSVSGSNVNGTKESGEPNHAGNAGGRSIWYRWTASTADLVTIDTVGSAFNTLLAVYTGSSVSSLSTIASNDDIDVSNTGSRVSFTPVAGTTYQIAVDGFSGASGNVTLNWNQATPPPPPPANDAFANAQALTGSSGTVSGSNASATKESGEPNHAGNAGGRSIWYRWTAPTTAPVTIDTIGSAFNTLLGVYTGSSVSSLTTIASNDNIDGSNTRSRVSFTPVAGTTYRIAVDGSGGQTGNVTLNWIQTPQNLPDLIIWGPSVSPRFATVTFSSSSCAVVEGMVQSGTRRLLRFSTETRNQGTADIFLGNPASNPLFVYAPCHGHYHFNNYANYRLLDSNNQSVANGLKIGFCLLDSIRWSSSAPSSARYTCSNQGIQRGWGDLYDSTLDGQWIDITGVPDGSYTLELEVNPEHILQESDYSNNITRVGVTIGNAAPANNSFANAQGLSGGSASVAGTTVNATKESGEPNHAGNSGGRSIWYFWTAPGNTSVVIDTVGSSFDTLLAVYRGSSVSSLTAVASNDDIVSGNQQSRVTFTPVAGTTYRIAVDGYNGASGSVVLTLSQIPSNDNFAFCEFTGGANGSVTGSTRLATKESGEPSHAGNSGGLSIWYCWTAPDSGSVTFDTIGSNFDTLLAAYTGDTVNSLTVKASNDNISGNNTQSRITFTVVATTMYHIAIDGRNGASGNTTLNWNLTTGVQLAAFRDTFGSGDTEGDFERPALGYNRLSVGEYELVIAGPPSRRYAIEVSSDLTDWVTLATTLADSAGTAYFRDKTTVHVHNDIADLVGGPDPLCTILPSAVPRTEESTGSVAVTERGESRFYRVVEVP